MTFYRGVLCQPSFSFQLTLSIKLSSRFLAKIFAATTTFKTANWNCFEPSPLKKKKETTTTKCCQQQKRNQEFKQNQKETSGTGR